MPRETWLPLLDAARLLAVSRQAVQKNQNIVRRRARSSTGWRWEVALSSLPPSAQARYHAHRPVALHPSNPPAAPPADVHSAGRRPFSQAGDGGEDPHVAAWDAFYRLHEAAQNEGRRRLNILADAYNRAAGATSTTTAWRAVASAHGLSLATLYRWRSRVRSVPRAHWLPYLATIQGGGRRTDIPDEAWSLWLSDYLRLEAPSAKACYRRLKRAADAEGWDLPSLKTFMRRLDDVSKPAQVLAREGADALDRLYPAQERDRSGMYAMQAVNADGHMFDVRIEWDDGTISRPILVGWQDVYSGKILSWRLDKSENKEMIRLSFGDLVETYGVPGHAYLDNGRAFMSKAMTGRMKTRYRFKLKDEDPEGIMKLLGVAVHAVKPYHGQSKPIERAWRDLVEEIARHPACSGAYTGTNPTNKPANYGSRALPIEYFRGIVDEEIRAHNAREGRRSAVCAGRSLDETFAESYAQAVITKATPEQRRLWLCAAESVTVSRQDRTVRLMGNRYWSEALADRDDRRVLVRFDPDDLYGDVFVYALDGRYIGPGTCTIPAGFADAEAAREHARQKTRWIKKTREALEHHDRMTALEVARRTRWDKDDAPTPEPGAVRPIFRRAVAAASAGGDIVEPLHDENDTALEERFTRAFGFADRPELDEGPSRFERMLDIDPDL